MQHPFSFRLIAWMILPLLGLIATTTAVAQDPKTTQAAITNLLQQFLLRNDEPAQHDRFWADDVVYTSSMGEVTTKPQIMKSVTGQEPDPAAPKETYSAEDILVRPYGTTAALTFRLVRHAADGKLFYYRNSGTFLLRNGQWQAITWQATKVADADAKPSK